MTTAWLEYCYFTEKRWCTGSVLCWPQLFAQYCVHLSQTSGLHYFTHKLRRVDQCQCWLQGYLSWGFNLLLFIGMHYTSLTSALGADKGIVKIETEIHFWISFRPFNLIRSFPFGNCFILLDCRLVNKTHLLSYRNILIDTGLSIIADLVIARQILNKIALLK